MDRKDANSTQGLRFEQRQVAGIRQGRQEIRMTDHLQIGQAHGQIKLQIDRQLGGQGIRHNIMFLPEMAHFLSAQRRGLAKIMALNRMDAVRPVAGVLWGGR
jgi:hypothetical protein